VITKGQCYRLKWKNKEAKGCIDLISSDFLLAKKRKAECVHPMLCSWESGPAFVSFELLPKDGALLFRYGGVHAKKNRRLDIYLGDLRIEPSKFPNATEIAWRDEKSDEFKMYPVSVELIQSSEGRRGRRQATFLSRNSSLAIAKRSLAKANGEMKCEACKFPGGLAYGEAADVCFEVHHKKPLSKGSRMTSLNDLALLCANCHRAIHSMGDIPYERFRARFRDAPCLDTPSGSLPLASMSRKRSNPEKL